MSRSGCHSTDGPPSAGWYRKSETDRTGSGRSCFGGSFCTACRFWRDTSRRRGGRRWIWTARRSPIRWPSCSIRRWKSYPTCYTTRLHRTWRAGQDLAARGLRSQDRLRYRRAGTAWEGLPPPLCPALQARRPRRQCAAWLTPMPFHRLTHATGRPSPKPALTFRGVSADIAVTLNSHSSRAARLGPCAVSLARACLSFPRTAEPVAPPPSAVCHPS
jgi:hypothetical protein